MKLLTRIFLFLCLSGVFLSGSISMIEEWAYLTNIVLFISCLGIIITYIFNYKITLKIPRVLTGIFLSFLFFMLISSLFNGNVQMLLSSLRYLLIFVTLCLIIPCLLKEKTLSITVWSFLLSQLPLLLLSFIELNPFSDFSGTYFGIFYNPNSFGIFTATIFIVLLALIYSYVGTRRLMIPILLITLFILFLLIAFSGSRTSFIAIVLVLLISLALPTVKKLDFNNISLKKIRFYFFSLIGFASFTIWFLQSSFYEIMNYRIIEKFVYKFNSGDVLDKRGDILIETISDLSMFGHGPEYFNEQFGLGAHNSFVSLLGQYGLLATSFFILFWIYSTFRSLKYYKTSKNKLSILPFIVIMFFLITSMTEIMLMKASMLISFVSIGVINLEIFQNNYSKIFTNKYSEKYII